MDSTTEWIIHLSNAIRSSKRMHPQLHLSATEAACNSLCLSSLSDNLATFLQVWRPPALPPSRAHPCNGGSARPPSSHQAHIPGLFGLAHAHAGCGCQDAAGRHCAGSSRQRRRRAPVQAMALPAPTDAEVSSFALAATVTGALSFAVFRAVVYFRMQYFIAELLGRHVPRGGARVLDLGIREGRNLYYYPKDTVQVVAVSPKPDVQMLENQAINAKVPIRIVPDFSKIPANSMDAVVSVYGMAEMSDEEVASALNDAVRVLKPGKKFIYVENVGSDNALVRGAQQLIESIGKSVGRNYTITRNVLPFVQNAEGLGDLKYETLLGFQDPHLVGIAIKQGRTPTSTSSGIDKEKVPKKDRAPKKGFAPQKIEFPGQ